MLGLSGRKWVREPNVRVSEMFNPNRREIRVPEYRRVIKDPNTSQWRRGPVSRTTLLVKVFQWLDSTSAKELERGLPTGSRLWYQLVTPSIQSYTNHTHKCVRSRSRAHGKISQHNSRYKLKIIQALYYKPGASRARIHKLEYTRVSGSNNIWVQT